MNKNYLLLSVIGFSLAAPAVTIRNADTDWFAKAQFGAFMHYLPGGEDFKNIDKFRRHGGFHHFKRRHVCSAISHKALVMRHQFITCAGATDRAQLIGFT